MADSAHPSNWVGSSSHVEERGIGSVVCSATGTRSSRSTSGEIWARMTLLRRVSGVSSGRGMGEVKCAPIMSLLKQRWRVSSIVFGGGGTCRQTCVRCVSDVRNNMCSTLSVMMRLARTLGQARLKPHIPATSFSTLTLSSFVACDHCKTHASQLSSSRGLILLQ